MKKKLFFVLFVSILLVATVVVYDLFFFDPKQPDTVSDSELQIAFNQEPQDLELGQTNVVLIIGCTLRKDRLETYGFARPTSPFMRLWGEQSIVFDSHISQAPWTRPSIGSIITGRYPRVLKLDNPNTDRSFRMVLKDEFTTLAEVFQANGYHTIGSVGNPNAKIRFGLGQGFNHYNEPDKTFRDHVSLPSGGDLVSDVIDQISGIDQPFFAQLIFVDTHLPVQAPMNYQPLFSGQRKRLKEYDASIRKLDGHLAELIAGVRAEHPNTLFVLTADHGEGLKEPKHHGVGHGRYLYQSVIALPHVWMHPAFEQPGRRVEQVTRNIDILPTLVDLFDIKGHWKMDGESFASVLLNADSVFEDIPAFTETFFKKASKSSVTYGEYHLIRNRKNSEEWLYRRSDTTAEKNIIDEHPSEVALLNDLLDGWEVEVAALATDVGEALEAPLDDETQDMLEAMGYIED